MKAPFIKATALTSMLLFAASAANAASPHTMEAWEAKLRTKLENANDYPVDAINSGIEGTVKVRIIFNATGEIDGAELIEKSGSRVLDRSVLSAALKLDNIPALPAGQEQLALVIPVTFKIQDKS